MTRRPGPVALVLCALLVGACTERFDRIPAQGEAGGRALATPVDDPIAE